MVNSLASHLGFPLSDEVARKVSYFHRLTRSPLGAFLLVVIAVGTGVLPLIYIAPVPILLMRVGLMTQRGVQRFYNWGVGCWLYAMTVVIESLLGVRIKTFGDGRKFKGRCLFLMNHISHFDWMYFWLLVGRQGDLSTWTAVTKDTIRKLPILGQCMQYGNYLFITRKWEKDEPEFREKLYYCNGLKLPLQLLLFAEGGDLTKKSKAKSDQFADENGLPRYDYCLHPRTTGFVYIVNAMRDGGLDAVCDVTVGYPDSITKTEHELFKGIIPREIHYYIKTYDAKDLPTNDHELAEWCRDRWREKEEKLRDFYTHREFLDRVSPGGEHIAEKGSRYCKPKEVYNEKKYRSLFIAVVFYIWLNTLLAYLVYTSWIVVLYGVVSIIFTIYATVWRQGIDYLIMSFSRDSTDRALLARSSLLMENGTK